MWWRGDWKCVDPHSFLLPFPRLCERLDDSRMVFGKIVIHCPTATEVELATFFCRLAAIQGDGITLIVMKSLPPVSCQAETVR